MARRELDNSEWVSSFLDYVDSRQIIDKNIFQKGTPIQRWHLGRVHFLELRLGLVVEDKLQPELKRRSQLIE